MNDEKVDINEMYFAFIESEDEEGIIIYGNVRKLENGKVEINEK